MENLRLQEVKRVRDGNSPAVEKPTVARSTALGMEAMETLPRARLSVINNSCSSPNP